MQCSANVSDWWKPETIPTSDIGNEIFYFCSICHSEGQSKSWNILTKPGNISGIPSDLEKALSQTLALKNRKATKVILRRESLHINDFSVK